MAALTFIAVSILDEIYRVGCVFIHSRGSIRQCWQFIVDEREEYLNRKYLQYLDKLADEKFSSAAVELTMNEYDDCGTQFDDIEEYRHIDQLDVGQERKNTASQLIQEASLVYSCSTINELIPGSCFFISGTILKNCERFSINLALDLFSSDIALHINPRLPQNYIVRNTRLNGRWGKEEVTSVLPFCLKRGAQFKFQIIVTELEYFISINGNHFAAFRHRIPYDRVTCLQVKGDVVDIKVDQSIATEYPDRQQLNSENVNVEIINLFDDEKEQMVWKREHFLHIPYSGILPINFDRGKNLHILGRVKTLPHSFYFNLQNSDNIWPHPMIAYHLNQRFAHVGGHHIICQNSWIDGKWSREERTELRNAFQPAQKFHLIIMAQDTAYHVYLNDRLISEYHYRCDPEMVDVIYVQGDIKLKAIILETQPVSKVSDVFNFVDDL